MENFKFHNDAPILKYFQKSLNSCCFSSLASALVSIEQIKSANDISFHIEEPLKSKDANHIDFVNTILKNRKIIKGETKVYYTLKNIKIWALMIF